MRSNFFAGFASMVLAAIGQATVPPPLYDPPGAYIPDYLQPPVREANLGPIVRPAVVTTTNDEALRVTRRARLIVSAPLGAEVFVQGQKMADQFRTDEDGHILFQSTRLFVSPALVPGKSYVYNVRARWFEGDLLYDVSQDVKVWPGAVVKTDFLEQEMSPP